MHSKFVDMSPLLVSNELVPSFLNLYMKIICSVRKESIGFVCSQGIFLFTRKYIAEMLRQKKNKKRISEDDVGKSRVYVVK